MNAFVQIAPLGLTSTTLDIDTERRMQFVDITEAVVRHAQESQIKQGQALVFCRHTTAGVLINEHEPLLLEDLGRTLDRMAHPEEDYHHDDLTRRTENLVEGGEPPNGHSHCQHLTVGCSVTIPIIDGEIGLGRWQRVFLVELDSARPRQVIIQVWGQA